ncbi:MAG: hypothetical protein JWM31_1962, partial [Solirubrobacterales bacterium]|nr:hypothetical protein [Solirubrobacterales bacterium]
FENYGNDVDPENMTPYEVEDIFGEGVCVRGTGTSCVLSPLAAKWMETQNEAMSGGHCMGFSVTALRMFTKAVKAKDYGASQPVALPIQGNTDLQSLIAESWTYQNLPGIQAKVVEGTPTAVLAKLEAALNSGKEQYTLAIFRADGGGGHAITPFAVEDKGDGTKEILVYDNNFPGIIRKVDIDTQANSWHYVGGTNPKDLTEVYEGDADTQSLSLYPTSPGEEYQPCPFCKDGNAGATDPQPNTDSTVGALGAVKDFNEIRLHSGRKNHPHLILTDEKGRQTGIVGGKLINDIPGVELERNLAVQNWEETPEPAYRTPVGLPMAVSVDGSELTKKVTANVTLSGAGLAIEVDSIKLKPGQTDYIEFLGSGLGLTYETDPSSTTSPDLYATLEDGDVTKGGGYYVLGVTALGFSAGSRIGFTIDQQGGRYELSTEGTKPSKASDGLGGKSLYAVTMVREKASGQAQWLTDPILLKGGKIGERLRIDYRHATGGKPLRVVGGKPGGPFTVYRGNPEK